MERGVERGLIPGAGSAQAEGARGVGRRRILEDPRFPCFPVLSSLRYTLIFSLLVSLRGPVLRAPPLDPKRTLSPLLHSPAPSRSLELAPGRVRFSSPRLPWLPASAEQPAHPPPSRNAPGRLSPGRRSRPPRVRSPSPARSWPRAPRADARQHLKGRGSSARLALESGCRLGDASARRANGDSARPSGLASPGHPEPPGSPALCAPAPGRPGWCTPCFVDAAGVRVAGGRVPRAGRGP